MFIDTIEKPLFCYSYLREREKDMNGKWFNRTIASFKIWKKFAIIDQIPESNIFIFQIAEYDKSKKAFDISEKNIFFQVNIGGHSIWMPYYPEKLLEELVETGDLVAKGGN